MIRKATKSDIDWMVELSHQKRLSYSKEQPNFWKMAENSDEVQQKYFEKELKNDNVIAMIYEEKQGFMALPDLYKILLEIIRKNPLN